MLKVNVPLRLKITTLVAGVAFSSAFVVAGINYHGVRELSSEMALEKLASETQLAALNIKNAYDVMWNDVLTMARAPSTKGLIFSMRNGGTDPRDGSTSDHWRQRLNTIFRLAIEAQPHYAQIRYIGVADNGRELARVNRAPDGKIEFLKAEATQEKGGEPYFREGMKLRSGEVYLSKVQQDVNGNPTVRLVTPVFDTDETMLGLIVINLKYESFLRDAISLIDLLDAVYLADDYGNYVERLHDMAPSNLHVVQFDASGTPNFIREFASRTSQDDRFAVGDLVGYRHRVAIAPAPSAASVNVFVLVPRSKLFATANFLLRRSLLSGGLLIATAVLAAVILSNRLTKPIVMMIAEIRALAENSKTPSNLPVHLHDEVGALARAFSDLAARLDLSHAIRAKLSVQLDAFITNSVDGFIIISGQGLIELVNPALISLFGYERDELIGRHVSILMPEDTEHEAEGKRGGASGIQQYIGTIRDKEARHKDGSVLPIALSVSELALDGSSVFTAIVRDMTVVRHAQREARRYAAELERSNQELDQFAYVASHDLKAPLRVINNASLWLEEDLAGKLNDDDRENLLLLRNRAQRMERLLDDLLEYSRVGQADDPRYKEIIDGGALISDMLLLLTPPAGIEIRVAAGLGGMPVPRMPLQMVLYNLINNAIKHHDRETGLIEIEALQRGGFLHFTVHDDGPGIPKAFQEKIFEMFYTLKPRDEVAGSGMGLALVKKTIERWGGAITVTSDGPRGSAFTFTWPYAPSTEALSEQAA